LQPIVVSLAFGVFMAFFVTLLMVPSLYGIGIDIKNGARKLFRRRNNTDDSNESSSDEPDITVVN